MSLEAYPKTLISKILAIPLLLIGIAPNVQHKEGYENFTGVGVSYTLLAFEPSFASGNYP